MFWRVPHLLVMLPALALLWFVMVPAAAETVDGRRIVIVDGDTIALGNERVRLLNIDAPESFRPRCERELISGLKAKARLAELLRAGHVVITRTGEDRYRRTLARVVAGDRRDVGDTLVREGLALPWQSGPEAKATRGRHWCG